MQEATPGLCAGAQRAAGVGFDASRHDFRPVRRRTDGMRAPAQHDHMNTTLMHRAPVTRGTSKPALLLSLPLAFSLTLAVSASLLTAQPAIAQISFGVSLPGLQIGINVPVYPRLIRVPGYPVYYDEQAENNYFFYDGLYWVFRDDIWYQSSWYNGPWLSTQPDDVPLYVLRVPVRYYRQPPPFFRGWRGDAPPRWGDHFGRDWRQGHNNWDHWDRRSVPLAAPLPTYQRHYSGEQYPQAHDRQQAVRDEHYRYPGRDGAQQPQLPRVQPQPRPQAEPRPQPQPRPHVEPRPQPQPQTQPPAPERRQSANGPANNPGQGQGQGRGPERGPDKGGPPGRGERPERDPR